MVVVIQALCIKKAMAYKKLDKAADLYKKVYDNNIKLCADILFFALNTNQGILEFPKLAQCFWLAAAVKNQGILELLKEIASLCSQ